MSAARPQGALASLVSGDRILAGDALALRVKQTAGGLAELGLAPGDVVALLMRNDFAFIEVSLAAESAGLVAVPLNWHGSNEEIGHILLDSAARVLVGHADLLRSVGDAIPSHVRVIEVAVAPEIRQAYRLADSACALSRRDLVHDEWVASSPVWDQPAIAPPFRLLYTSGTTGKPKGVVRAQAPAELGARIAHRTRLAHGLEQRPIRAVMTGPLYHSAPNAYALNCVRYGELLVLQPRFDAPGLLDLVEAHRLSHMHMVPTMFSRLLDLPQARKDRFDATSLVAVAHGAAMCPSEVKRSMIDWWGPVILEYYAATEIGIVAACTTPQWLAHPGSVGRAPEGVRLRIVDDAGEPVATGEQGEIQIQTDAAALLSYRHRPEAMEELRRGEWITLGDIGYLDGDGFLWICDRKKDMVISGGVNIYPAELEAAALQLPQVKDCVAFGIPDRDLGEAVALFYEAHPAAPGETGDIADHLRRHLGSLRTPRLVRRLDHLPREDSGKVARRKLRQGYLEELATARTLP